MAEVAQNYAEQCVFAHNTERVAQQDTFNFVGENLAAISGSTDYMSFVRSWYDDVTDESCDDSAVYTQVS